VQSKFLLLIRSLSSLCLCVEEVASIGSRSAMEILPRSGAFYGRGGTDLTRLRFLVGDHDTCVTNWPGSALLLQADQNSASARNLSILRRLFQPASAFLTDRRRCCKP